MVMLTSYKIKLISCLYLLFGVSVLCWYVFYRTSSYAVIKLVDKGYFFRPCQCVKHRNRVESMLVPSTCSEESTWYGPHQKVISYSLFQGRSKSNNLSDFVTGIHTNLKQFKKYYPGWVVRIYTNETLNEEYCRLACTDLLFWCDIRNSIVPNLKKANGRSWRFVPLGDESVDIFISRDLDSYITGREKEIVTVWEYLSDKPFHAARDRRVKDRPVQAGLWGAKNNILGWKRAKRIRNELLKMARMKGIKGRDGANVDEISLWKLVYNPYSHEFLHHDSYVCRKWNGSVPFPKQRPNQFVFVPIEIRSIGKFKAERCPVACRPTYGKNWTYC